MPMTNDWSSPDQRKLMHLSPATLDVFVRYVQIGDQAPESGGLLLGTVHGEHLIIEQATTPTAWDLRLRTFFHRSAIGHAKLAFDRWRASHGTVRYLGEWHTHPEDYPTPSGLDRSEWRRLAAGRRDKRPQLSIIVGRQDLHVELVNSDGIGVLFQPHV
jgi:integrative and conjugative element protein (TIGR02256 family)